MEFGSFGGTGADYVFDFMLDELDLINYGNEMLNSDNNIEIPPNENIEPMVNEGVELPTVPGSDQPSSDNQNGDINLEDLENVLFDNNHNLVLLGTSIDPSAVPLPQAQHLNAQLNTVNEQSQDGGVPPLHPQQELNEMQPFQGENIGTDYFVNNNQQMLNSESFTENSVGVIPGNSSLVNQQQVTWLPQNQNPSYNPPVQSGPVQESSDPWTFNPIQPQLHAAQRSQQLPVQPQQLSQVPETPIVVVDPPPHFPDPFQMTMPFVTQNSSSSGQSSQGPLMHDVNEQQGHSSIMQGPMPSRPQQLLHHQQQNNQVQITQNVQNMRYPQSQNPVPSYQPSMVPRHSQVFGQGQIRPVVEALHQFSKPSSYMQTRPRQSTGFGHINQVSRMSSTKDPPQAPCSLLIRNSRYRPREGQFQGLTPTNQLANANVSNLLSNRHSHQTQRFHRPSAYNRSQGVHQQEKGIERRNLAAVSRRLQASTYRENERWLAQLTRGRPQSESGESSSRPMKRVARREEGQSGLDPQQVFDIFQSEANDDEDGTRKIINGVYDPFYEDIGLPIDPHLRLFTPRN